MFSLVVSQNLNFLKTSSQVCTQLLLFKCNVCTIFEESMRQLPQLAIITHNKYKRVHTHTRDTASKFKQHAWKNHGPYGDIYWNRRNCSADKI